MLPRRVLTRRQARVMQQIVQSANALTLISASSASLSLPSCRRTDSIASWYTSDVACTDKDGGGAGACFHRSQLCLASARAGGGTGGGVRTTPHARPPMRDAAHDRNNTHHNIMYGTAANHTSNTNINNTINNVETDECKTALLNDCTIESILTPHAETTSATSPYPSTCTDSLRGLVQLLIDPDAAAVEEVSMPLFVAMQPQRQLRAVGQRADWLAVISASEYFHAYRDTRSLRLAGIRTLSAWVERPSEVAISDYSRGELERAKRNYTNVRHANTSGDGYVNDGNRTGGGSSLSLVAPSGEAVLAWLSATIQRAVRDEVACATPRRLLESVSSNHRVGVHEHHNSKVSRHGDNHTNNIHSREANIYTNGSTSHGSSNNNNNEDTLKQRNVRQDEAARNGLERHEEDYTTIAEDDADVAELCQDDDRQAGQMGAASKADIEVEVVEEEEVEVEEEEAEEAEGWGQTPPVQAQAQADAGANALAQPPSGAAERYTNCTLDAGNEEEEDDDMLRLAEDDARDGEYEEAVQTHTHRQEENIHRHHNHNNNDNDNNNNNTSHTHACNEAVSPAAPPLRPRVSAEHSHRDAVADDTYASSAPPVSPAAVNETVVPAASSTPDDDNVTLTHLAELMLRQFNSADGYLHRTCRHDRGKGNNNNNNNNNSRNEEDSGLVVIDDAEDDGSGEDTAHVDTLALFSAYHAARVTSQDWLPVRALKYVWNCFNAHQTALEEALAGGPMSSTNGTSNNNKNSNSAKQHHVLSSQARAALVALERRRSVEALVYGAVLMRTIAREVTVALPMDDHNHFTPLPHRSNNNNNVDTMDSGSDTTMDYELSASAELPMYGFPLLSSDTRAGHTHRRSSASSSSSLSGGVGEVTDMTASRVADAVEAYTQFFAHPARRATPFRPNIAYNAGCGVVMLTGSTLHLYETSLKHAVREDAVRICFAEALLGVLHVLRLKMLPRVNTVHFHILVTDLSPRGREEQEKDADSDECGAAAASLLLRDTDSATDCDDHTHRSGSSKKTRAVQTSRRKKKGPSSFYDEEEDEDEDAEQFASARSESGTTIVGIDLGGLWTQKERARLVALASPLGLAAEMEEFTCVDDLVNELESALRVSVVHDLLQTREDLNALLTPTLVQLLPGADGEEEEDEHEHAQEQEQEQDHEMQQGSTRETKRVHANVAEQQRAESSVQPDPLCRGTQISRSSNNSSNSVNSAHGLSHTAEQEEEVDEEEDEAVYEDEVSQATMQERVEEERTGSSSSPRRAAQTTASTRARRRGRRVRAGARRARLDRALHEANSMNANNNSHTTANTNSNINYSDNDEEEHEENDTNYANSTVHYTDRRAVHTDSPTRVETIKQRNTASHAATATTNTAPRVAVDDDAAELANDVAALAGDEVEEECVAETTHHHASVSATEEGCDTLHDPLHEDEDMAHPQQQNRNRHSIHVHSHTHATPSSPAHHGALASLHRSRHAEQPREAEEKALPRRGSAAASAMLLSRTARVPVAEDYYDEDDDETSEGGRKLEQAAAQAEYDADEAMHTVQRTHARSTASSTPAAAAAATHESNRVMHATEKPSVVARRTASRAPSAASVTASFAQPQETHHAARRDAPVARSHMSTPPVHDDANINHSNDTVRRGGGGGGAHVGVNRSSDAMRAADVHHANPPRSDAVRPGVKHSKGAPVGNHVPTNHSNSNSNQVKAQRVNRAQEIGAASYAAADDRDVTMHANGSNNNNNNNSIRNQQQQRHHHTSAMGMCGAMGAERSVQRHSEEASGHHSRAAMHEATAVRSRIVTRDRVSAAAPVSSASASPAAMMRPVVSTSMHSQRPTPPQSVNSAIGRDGGVTGANARVETSGLGDEDGSAAAQEQWFRRRPKKRYF